MLTFALKINAIILALLLTACGSGVESGIEKGKIPKFSVSGTISSAALVAVDSDLNDPHSTLNISNNTFSTAQIVQNFYTINGFATAIPTNREGTNDRFEFIADTIDNYQVNLQANQTIRLQVVDYGAGSEFQGDLDLILFNSSGLEISRSDSKTEFESVTIPSDGSFYIQVLAVSGTSKYVLNIDSSSNLNSSSTNPTQASFKVNEAIIKFKASTNQSIKSNLQFQFSHNSNERPVLSHFTPLQVQSFSTKQSLTQNEPLFLSELRALNLESYERYTTLNAIKALNQRDDIEYAEPNYIRTIKQVPNDTHYSKQWHYPAINLPQAWDLTTGTPDSGDVIVAVIDTGVFLGHEDLDDQLVNGYDFIADPVNAADGNGIDTNPDDPGDGAQSGTSSWHGTHVSGTIAAESNNISGVTGVSWGAKIMPLRVLGAQGGTTYDIAQAVLFAAGLPNDSGTIPAQKADIINLSLGGPGFSQTSQNTYNQAIAAGVIVIAAAGNENSSQLSYPASYDGVISVAASDFDNNRAPYSNFGSQIDITAPGGDGSKDNNNDGHADGIFSLLVDDSTNIRKSAYVFYQGTSMASPHVAGVIALMRSVHPGLTPNDVDILLASGSITNDIGVSGRDDIFGYGLIDALKAVNEAQALANGGVIPVLPPLFTASPSTLTLGFNSSSSITVSNTGSEASVTSVNDNADWLEVSTTNVDNNGLGTYKITINRTGLDDSIYSGLITFNLSTEKTLEVQITMIVGTVSSEGDIGTQFVLLLDQSTGNIIHQTAPSKSNNGDYNYQFTNISAGSYQILSGSDIDNDLIICQLGESCGGFPVLSKLSDILVSDTNISGLDFISGVLSNFGATSDNKASSPNRNKNTEIASSKKIIGVLNP